MINGVFLLLQGHEAGILQVGNPVIDRIIVLVGVLEDHGNFSLLPLSPFIIMAPGRVIFLPPVRCIKAVKVVGLEVRAFHAYFFSQPVNALIDILFATVRVIHIQVYKRARRRPFQRRAPGRLEGHLVSQQRAVSPVGKQHPVPRLSRADEIGLGIQLERIRLLGIRPPGTVSASADLGIPFVHHGVAARHPYLETQRRPVHPVILTDDGRWRSDVHTRQRFNAGRDDRRLFGYNFRVRRNDKFPLTGHKEKACQQEYRFGMNPEEHLTSSKSS